MISLSQRPYAGQHTILTTDRHQCPRRYSNPQYHPASGCRPTSKTAQPLGPACLVDWLSLCHCSQTTVKIKLKMPIFFTGRYCCCVYPCIVLGFSSLNFNWLYCVCVCVSSAPFGWSPLAMKFLTERFQNITLARRLLQMKLCRNIIPGYCAGH